MEDKKRVIEFTRKGNWGNRVIKLVGLEKDTRMIFKRLSKCSHTKLNYCYSTVFLHFYFFNKKPKHEFPYKMFKFY